MRKVYNTNHRLELARALLFNMLKDNKTIDLSDAFELSSGDNLPKSKMTKGDNPVFGGGGITDNTHAEYNIDYKTVGIGRVGARCGCSFIITPKSWVTDNALYIAKLKHQYDYDFLMHYLNFADLNKYSKQSAQPVISQKGIAKAPIPVVELDTQKNIASVLNAIENNSTYDDIFNIDSKLTSQSNIEALISEIDSQLNNIQLLRQTILQEAVQGKLVPQANNDEPASELLKKIQAEKEKLVKDKKIKKTKPLPPITDDEIPYELPEGWVWCRLGALGVMTGGGTPSKNNTSYWGGNILWITPKDMKQLQIGASIDTITLEGVNNSSAKLIPKNSILIVARSGILKRHLPVAINLTECTVNQDIKVLIPFNGLYSEYIQLLLRGNEKYILDNLVKYGMTVHSLLYKEFELEPFPIPPLAEQQRIVAKVEQLMQLCNDLETQVLQSKTDAEQLLQALLREAFEGGGNEEPLPLAAEPEEAYKTK